MNNDAIKGFLDSPGYGPAPESDADVREWLKRHNYKFGNGSRFDEVLCPATKEKLADVAIGTREDVDAAVAAADGARFPWKQGPGYERAKYLYAIARALHRHARKFAVLEALNNGKTIRETRDIDVPLAIRHFYYHAGWAKRHQNEFPDIGAGGVVGQIIPWNFPLLMLAWKIAPAIAVGNTVVLKPSEYTPLTALLFDEILKDEVGLPEGVVNIVTGDGETGQHLVNHPVPWKIAFTGSTEVGRIIRRATAGTGKRLTLELGGKSPLVVFEDADLDSAVEGVVNAIWFNQGQVCCAGSRLLVQESVYAQFIGKLKTRMKRLRAGHPLDKAVDMGAINSEAQFCKIKDLVEIGKREGDVWQPENWLPDLPGYYFPPTLIENVSTSATVAREEIFGPVLVCMSFRTPEEAVQLANNTRYGLAASVWSERIGKAFDCAKKIKAGTIWINDTNRFDASSGFGGYRESGYGREGGSEGIREYLRDGADTIEYAPRNEFDPRDHISLIGKKTEIDRTYRLFIGGKLARPDGDVSFRHCSPTKELLAVLPDANRKDTRNAVEAARKAYEGWAGETADLRAKILFFFAENLAAQKDRFAEVIAKETHASFANGAREVDLACERLFDCASLADKFEGRVHSVPAKMLVVALKEPVGVLGIRATDDYPLLGAVAAIAPAIAMGNAVVYIAGKLPLAAMELIQVIQNSDVPAGVINVLSAAKPDSIAKVLAEHEDVDGIWYFGNKEGVKMVEECSASNMKRAWAVPGRRIDWISGANRFLLKFLYEATQVKNIWSPYGI